MQLTEESYYLGSYAVKLCKNSMCRREIYLHQDAWQNSYCCNDCIMECVPQVQKKPKEKQEKYIPKYKDKTMYVSNKDSKVTLVIE